MSSVDPVDMAASYQSFQCLICDHSPAVACRYPPWCSGKCAASTPDVDLRPSPAYSMGSHGSGISHPPGSRNKRRSSIKAGMPSEVLLKRVYDWVDAQSRDDDSLDEQAGRYDRPQGQRYPKPNPETAKGNAALINFMQPNRPDMATYERDHLFSPEFLLDHDSDLSIKSK
ncbi:hypothetical protein BDV23DRAFT_188224 [Aspergillus alliaceus]|uniref:Uncharacterized protein n=1 Tax=Petromyces alliaceus TaxID=209559 RepID=A0A5N7BUH4_PETAA|nr:hypothetical protein BDV23DRAFT_188224 [Aspergillus alliaceus]